MCNESGFDGCFFNINTWRCDGRSQFTDRVGQTLERHIVCICGDVPCPRYRSHHSGLADEGTAGVAWVQTTHFRASQTSGERRPKMASQLGGGRGCDKK